MVKIRYAELPAGLHVVTEERDGCTIVYLQPGLTPSQRRAALTFARLSARIGHGASLPPVDLAFALSADRVRTTGRNLVSAVRRHPMLLLPLVAVVSGVIVVTMLSVVTVSASPSSHSTYPARDGQQTELPDSVLRPSLQPPDRWCVTAGRTICIKF
jgi:hypothetical protein